MFEFLPAALSFALLALFLGFKHSYDADHIVAVANLLRKSRSMKESFRMSISWSLGHMLTASGITAILYVFRESILQAILSRFELIVGIMLIGLGLYTIGDVFLFHRHEHSSGKAAHEHSHMHSKPADKKHLHKHMFGIGIVHGLASNDELLILLTASLGVTSLVGMLAGVAIFSIGVVGGMMLFAAIFSYPMLKIYSDRIYAAVSILVAVSSIVYGGMMLAGI